MVDSGWVVMVALGIVLLVGHVVVLIVFFWDNWSFCSCYCSYGHGNGGDDDDHYHDHDHGVWSTVEEL